MSYIKLILFSLLVACARAVHHSEDNCVIPFASRRSWDTFWPVVFNDKGELLGTSIVDGTDSVVIPQGQSVIVSCGPNYIKSRSPSEFVQAKCQTGSKYQIENDPELERAKDLACDLRSVQEILSPVVGCPRNMKAVKFGLVNPVDHKAYITGEACYSEAEGRTVFAHVRRGDLASAALEIGKKEMFKVPAPSSRYKVDFMKAFRLDELNDRLTSLMKVKEIPLLDMTHFVDNQFLLNRQLASTKKLGWNYFVIHSDLSNYGRLKDDIADLQGVVDIYTGSHGVSTMKNANGERVPIFLDDDRFPIPEMIWTVVRHDNKQMGFVVMNDPTLTEDEIKEKSFCQNKCDSVSWLKRLKENQQFAVARDGYVLCCDVKDLAGKIQEVPEI